jgi:hypothetical protein
MRITRCLTWWEPKRRSGAPILGASGERVGFVDLVEWVTLCGREEGSPKCAAPFEPRYKRPKGVCPQCWKSLLQSFEGSNHENTTD